MESIAGKIDHIVFTEPENGFTVALLQSKKNQDKTAIVGTFPSLHIGETIHCDGQWKHHPKFGRQFQVSTYRLSAPEDEIGILKYLESGAIRGIGPTYAKRIVQAFGKETLAVIEDEPKRLLSIEGIGEKRFKTIMESWQLNADMRDVMIFLRKHNISLGLAQKIYKRHGKKCIEVIKDNPYAIAHTMHGVGFIKADQIAQSLNIKNDHPQRIKAGVSYVLQKLSEQGHMCVPKEMLLQSAQELLKIPSKSIPPIIAQGIVENSLFELELEEDNTPAVYIWFAPFYHSERGIVSEIQRIQQGTAPMRPIHVSKALTWIEEQMEIKFAKEQSDAVKRAVSDKIHIITGGPGTGKSTITRAIIEITIKLSKSIICAAPTGKAAKRMSSITKRHASTIHSLLEFDFTTGKFKRNQDNPIECDLIIIDEASMIDTFLLFSLCKAIPTHCRVILIGDIDQLPSVGPGNTLRDLISSQTIPFTSLKQIFRQGKFSRISINAHLINRGLFPELAPKKNTDFHFIEKDSPEEIAQTLLDLSNPKALPFEAEQIQVLTPMKKGIIGTENLNIRFQAHLNPQSTLVCQMGRTFHLHDRVMQIRNNYNKSIFNGDVGKITSICHEDQELTLELYNREIVYSFNELDQLVLAYAVSVHKYQGSECPCILIPIHMSHFKLLFRNLLYTAITRGKRQVYLIGQKKALAMAIQNNEVKKRFTGLRFFLEQQLLSDRTS